MREFTGQFGTSAADTGLIKGTCREISGLLLRQRRKVVANPRIVFLSQTAPIKGNKSLE
jgi:hypothetical protein